MCTWFSCESWSTLNKWYWVSLQTGCRSCAGCPRTRWRGLQPPKKQMQNLMDILQFVAICVKPRLVFMARLLNFLCSSVASSWGIAPFDRRAHLRWWLTFLPQYNRVSVIPKIDWSDPDAMFPCDASLTGAGVGFKANICTPHSQHSFKCWWCTFMD